MMPMMPMMRTVGVWSRSFRALLALLLGMALLAGCGGGAAPGRETASDAPPPPPAPLAAWPLAPRPTPPPTSPALDAVQATSTAVTAALAPRDAARPALAGDWQVLVVHAWVADLPPGSGGAGGQRSVLVDLAAVNTRVDRSLTWDWLKRPQTLTLLAPDRRYLDLAPDGGAAVQAHPLLQAAVAAACPADGAAALRTIGAALTDATERGVTVPPRMPVRALTAFTLPADAAAPDGWMLQLRLPDGSARVRVALRLTPLAGTAREAVRASPTAAGTAQASPTAAGTAQASPTAAGTARAGSTATGDGIMGLAWDATGAPPLVLQALDRAVARSAVWRDWEITRAVAAPGGAAAWSRLRQCGATVAVTLDVTNRQTKSRPWLRAAWVADAAGRYVPATAPTITLDPGIPERITLTAPWPPLLGPPAAVILADGADATAISIVPPDAMEAPAYPPTATPTATPTGTPVTPTPMTGADETAPARRAWTAPDAPGGAIRARSDPEVGTAAFRRSWTAPDAPGGAIRARSDPQVGTAPVRRSWTAPDAPGGAIRARSDSDIGMPPARRSFAVWNAPGAAIGGRSDPAPPCPLGWRRSAAPGPRQTPQAARVGGVSGQVTES